MPSIRATSFLEPSSFKMFPLFVVMVGVVVMLGWKLSRTRKDTREPPVATTNIPFVGHLIGMLRYQGDYMKSLRCVPRKKRSLTLTSTNE